MNKKRLLAMLCVVIGLSQLAGGVESTSKISGAESNKIIQSTGSTEGKKIIGLGGAIHLGGVGRTPREVVNTGFEKVNALPKGLLDGLIMELAVSTNGGYYTGKCMTAEDITYDMLRPDVQAMASFDFKNLAGHFIRINVPSLTANWYDDEAKWSRILANIRVGSRAAKEAGAVGFMIDTEQYGANKPFGYMAQHDRMVKSFDEYRTQVRKRGRQFMEALSSSIPGPKVLITYCNSYVVKGPAPLHIRSMGLWPAFLDGMMDADEKAEFIDGYEQSYTYKTYEQFREARYLIKEEAASASQDPDRYRGRIKVGFGLWLGGSGGKLNMEDFTKNHFTPEEFKHALHYALRLSDGYVWLFAARWLRIPDEYMQAIVAARQPQSLTFSPAKHPGRGPLDYAMVSTKDRATFADGTVFKPYASAGYTELYDFPKQWRFRLDPEDSGLRERWYEKYNAPQWRDIEISDWYEPQLQHTYLGYSWYRFEFDASREWAGKKQLLLVFGAVDEEAWIWVNGRKAGEHAYGLSGWNMPFDIDVTDHIIPGRKNILHVRVHNAQGPGGIWKSVKIFGK